MARQRFKIDINDSIADIVRSEFPGVPVYQGNYQQAETMFFKINKIADTLNEMRRTSSDREYNVNLQLHIKNYHPRKRNKSFDMGARNAERLRQLLYSYKNQLLSSKKFFTLDNQRFVLAEGDNLNVRKNQDDLYNYHDLNVNNVSINIEESKNYFVFDFSINANVEKAATS